MDATDAVFQRALSKLLQEIFNGPEGDEAYILNPGDPGLLRQLESITASAASKRPAPGRATIAAHVEHLQYGLSLLNRWVAGEANPWADAQWDAAWRRSAVTEDEWRVLRGTLRRESDLWRSSAGSLKDWEDLTAAGALASLAHTAYHLGAIRQAFAVVDMSEDRG